MRWKEITVISSIILATFCFIYVFYGNNTNAEQNHTDISKLIDAMNKYDETMIEWSLYARESVYLTTEKEWADKQQQLEKQYPHMDWQSSMDEDSRSIIGTANHGAFTEMIKVLSTNLTDINRQTSYIIYEVKGTSWNSNVEKQISQLMDDNYVSLFDGKPVMFSCIKGEFNEEIDEILNGSLDEILHSFQAKEIESLKEEDFASISAHSTLFSQTLSLTNNEMNMQLALRKKEMGKGTIYVIGTPILTIEY